MTLQRKMNNSTSQDCTCSEELCNDQIKILYVFASISSLSLVSSTFTLSLTIYLKLYKNFAHRLAMYLVSSSIPTNIFHVSQLIAIKCPVACKYIGFPKQYFSSVELLFTMCFSFHIFSLAVLQRDYKRLERIYCIVSLVLPIFLVWIPYLKDHYGVSMAWCGITTVNSNSEIDWLGFGFLFGLWYIPVLIFQLFIVIVIVSIIIALGFRSCNRQENNDENEQLIVRKAIAIKHKKALKELLPILAYLIIFYLLTIIPLVHHIYYLFNSTQLDGGGDIAFAMAHVISDGLWGFNCSITQLIHISCNRWNKRKKKKNLQTRTDTRLPALTNDRFTISTGISTEFICLNESEVDRLLK